MVAEGCYRGATEVSVELAKQAKEGAGAEERRDTERVPAQSSEKASLGTIADLLAKSPKPNR